MDNLTRTWRNVLRRHSISLYGVPSTSILNVQLAVSPVASIYRGSSFTHCLITIDRTWHCGTILEETERNHRERREMVEERKCMCLYFSCFVKSPFCRYCVALPYPATSWCCSSAYTIWIRLASPFPRLLTYLNPALPAGCVLLAHPHCLWMFFLLETLLVWCSSHGWAAVLS